MRRAAATKHLFRHKRGFNGERAENLVHLQNAVDQYLDRSGDDPVVCGGHQYGGGTSTRFGSAMDRPCVGHHQHHFA